MKYKKIMLILIAAIFLVSIAGVCAADANGTTVASEDTSQIELSDNNKIIEDNRQTSGEKLGLSVDDESLSAQTDTNVLGDSPATYSDLSREINAPGTVILKNKSYTYDDAPAITISEDNKVIDGNGAVIDMAESTNMRAFTVSASGVTIKNLTIKNANYNGDGGAIYFSSSGTVSNCNFTNNKATGLNSWGGAIYMSSGSVENCNFTANQATVDGGAVYFYNQGTVTNCNFTDNHANNGGAVYFEVDGTVTNCNFTDNKAYYGGAIYFTDSGTTHEVRNCNFTNNQASLNGGAVYFEVDGTVTNCNFTGNTANPMGGAIYFDEYGTVTNCNFANNNATATNSLGGAIMFVSDGTVTNCNFTGNTASGYGGAINMGSGTVSNCNFTNNKATGDYSHGGAVYFVNEGTVTNCNFTDNKAYYGGAIYFTDSGTTHEVRNCNFTNNQASLNGGAIWMYSGSVENCNFTDNSAEYGGAIRFNGEGTVSNCNFTGNNATTGSAIYFYKWVSSDTLTVSNSTFLNNRANAGALDVVKNDNNITITFTGQNNLLNAIYSRNDAEVTFNNVKYWGANGITTVSAKLSGSNKAAGQNITVGVVVNGEIVLNNVKVTDENGMIVLDITAGENYYIGVRHDTDSYYTEAERTISNNINVNIISQTTTNKTVNITAKSNIYSEVIPGKLLFILPNSTQINANYAGNGTWWAVHTFDDYADYQVNATFAGLDNVTINNATITINKADSTLTVGDIVFDYGSSGSTTVSFDGASGVNASIFGQPNAKVSVDGNTITVSGLDVGTYTLSVTTIADANHNPVTKNATLTVNRAKTELTADAIITTYSVSKDLVITLKDSNGNPIGGLNITVDLNGTKNYTTDTNGQVKIPTNGLAANIYDVMISFNGTDNYLNSSNTTTVSIYKESSRVDTKPLTTDYNVHKYLVVGLKDNEGNPIRNADAFIEIHGVTYKCRSDDAGDARLIIRLNPGTYTAKITFDNVNYTGFTQYVTVIVKKITPKLTAKKKTFKKSKKVKKYTVTLKDNNGKAMAKVKLTLKVKGKTYKAKTNAKGKATFKIKNLKKKGKYRATVKFAGNTYYNKVTKKVKITVK